MSEFPENWFRDGGAGKSPGMPGADPLGEPTIPPRGASAAGGFSGEPTVQAPGPGYSPTAAGWAGAAGAQPGAAPASGGAWPEQPPVYQPGGPPGRGRRPGGYGGRGGWAGWRQRWLRPRWILLAVGVVIVAIIVATVGMYFYVNGKLVRQDILVNYTGRPALGAGQNWLITGSDSRQGLTRKQELQYATGKLSAISGQRSDTILILHIPSNGQPPVLVSIPRDSYVPIPGLGSSKINAAFDVGGPKLLAETVQNATGLYINHYMGIGFGGFVNVVNDIGGVRMCLPGPMKDPKAGLNLKAGCQNLNGGQALGYVRTRNFALSDLQREQDQRLFMKALLSKMTSPSVYLNPFAAIPAATGSAGALTVDQGTSLYQLIKAAFALRNPETTTVPISTASFQTSNDGVAVLWNRTEALQLFNALKNDTAVPRSLLTGSKSIGTG
jgi:LCP family protein required for cell wall assembly